MTSFLLFYSCCFRLNWLQPIHPQLRREPREKFAPLVLSFFTLFNLQGARPSSGTFAIISGSVNFVKHFFRIFFKTRKRLNRSLHRPNSLVRIPFPSRFVNGFSQVFLIYSISISYGFARMQQLLKYHCANSPRCGILTPYYICLLYTSDAADE